MLRVSFHVVEDICGSQRISLIQYRRAYDSYSPTLDCLHFVSFDLRVLAFRDAIAINDDVSRELLLTLLVMQDGRLCEEASWSFGST